MGATHEPDPFEDTRMTLGEHLEELRTRLIRSAIALVAVFVGSYVFVDPIAEFVMAPLGRAIGMLNADLVDLYEEQLADDPALARDTFFDPADSKHLREPIPTRPRGDAAHSGFFFQLKICLLFALAVAGPYMLWQLWQFIAAGLYAHERRSVYRLFPAAAALFVAGLAFGYTVLVPYGYYFLSRVSLLQIRHDPEVGLYFTFLTNLCLALGAVFQLPIVMTALARVELVQAATFARYRPHFLVGALAVSALLTPPDPITQMMMAVPMVVLYEVGILLARLSARKAAAVAPSEGLAS